MSMVFRKLLTTNLRGIIQAMKNDDIIYPVDITKYPITQTFKDHLARPGRYNGGWDISTPIGVDVVAPYDGYVDQAGFAATGYGNYVFLRHPLIERWSRFGHLSEVFVEVGQKIKKGQVIGKTGNTGNSSGPHLHFEWHKPSGLSTPIDPADEFCVELPEYFSKQANPPGEKKPKRNE